MKVTDRATNAVLPDQKSDVERIGEWTRAEIEAQIGRITPSTQFRTTAVLQSFLRFITEQTIAGNSESLTEHSIATEVFSRRSSFDSSVDTIVRTQAYRLRSKLREYYSAEGKSDPILIEIPKGHYIPQFSRNLQKVEEPEPQSVKIAGKLEPSHIQVSVKRSPVVYFRIAGAAIVLSLVFALGVFAGKRLMGVPTSNTAQRTFTSVDSFWANFVDNDQQPIVAYTNAVYLATENGSLLRFQSGPESDRGALVNPSVARQNLANRAFLGANEATYFENDLTGIGEVAGVAAIAQALERVGAHPIFKRSKQVSAYDLSNHNTIFLGSPFVHLILNDLPRPQNFRFIMPAEGPLLWTARIVNSRPENGESAFYSIERVPGTEAIRTEHAVVSMMPGLRPDRKILILAGLTTSGTQAAAQFATSLEGIQEMRRRLPHSGSSQATAWPASFEHLLRIRLNQGIDIVSAECIASR